MSLPPRSELFRQAHDILRVLKTEPQGKDAPENPSHVALEAAHTQMEQIITQECSAQIGRLEPRELSILLETRLHLVLDRMRKGSDKEKIEAWLTDILEFDGTNAHAHWFMGLHLWKKRDVERVEVERTKFGETALKHFEIGAECARKTGMAEKDVWAGQLEA